jgi:hypothetical protein
MLRAIIRHVGKAFMPSCVPFLYGLTEKNRGGAFLRPREKAAININIQKERKNMKKAKKLVAINLVLVMLLGIIPLNALAEIGWTDDFWPNIWISLNDAPARHTINITTTGQYTFVIKADDWMDVTPSNVSDYFRIVRQGTSVPLTPVVPVVAFRDTLECTFNITQAGAYILHFGPRDGKATDGNIQIHGWETKPLHTVTVAGDASKGEFGAFPGRAPAGESVSLYAHGLPGFEFDKWIGLPADTPADLETLPWPWMEMSDADVNVTATFKQARVLVTPERKNTGHAWCWFEYWHDWEETGVTEPDKLHLGAQPEIGFNFVRWEVTKGGSLITIDDPNVENTFAEISLSATGGSIEIKAVFKRETTAVAAVDEETAQAASDAVDELAERMAAANGATVKAAGAPVSVSAGQPNTVMALTMPKDTDTSKITTMVILNDDGTLTSVPARVDEDGNVVVLISDDVTLVPLSVEVSFVDIGGLSSSVAQEINSAASLMIVEGRGSGRFAPEARVTNQEAATMFLRALGVPVDFATAIGTAVEHGLVNATVIPNAPMARIETAVLIKNSLASVWMDQQISLEEARVIVAAFPDLVGLTDEEVIAMAICIELGIFSGASSGLMNPNNTLQRSQMASLAVRLQEVILGTL